MRKRWISIVAALTFSCGAPLTPAFAQATPPVSRIRVDRDAARVLDSLADEARERRTENAACATSYTVTDSVLTIHTLGPATYTWADSVTIGASSPVCAFGVPSVHAHVAFDGWPHPSDVDRNTARLRGIWNLLLSVRDNGWLVLIY